MMEPLSESDSFGEDNPVNNNGQGNFPMVPMSQDCIAWDEDHIVDLRNQYAAPRTATSGRLSSFFRSGANPPQQAFPQQQQPPQNHSSTEEIEGIFSSLNRSADGNERILPPPPPPRGPAEGESHIFPAPAHRHSYPPRNAGHETSQRKRSKTESSSSGSSMHSSLRGKLRKRSDVTNARKSGVNTKTTSPVPGCNRVASGSDQKTPNVRPKTNPGFLDLLQLVQTPSPDQFASEGQQQLQQNHLSKNTQQRLEQGASFPATAGIAANGNIVQSQLLHPTVLRCVDKKVAPVTAAVRNQVAKMPTAARPQPTLGFGKENLPASNKQGNPYSTNKIGSNLPKQQLPQSGSVGENLASNHIHKESNSIRTTTVGENTTSTRSHSAPTVEPPKVSPSNSAQSHSGAMGGSYDYADDEFGDLELSEADLAQMDSLVVAATQVGSAAPVIVPTSHRCNNLPNAPMFPVHSKSATAISVINNNESAPVANHCQSSVVPPPSSLVLTVNNIPTERTIAQACAPPTVDVSSVSHVESHATTVGSSMSVKPTCSGPVQEATTDDDEFGDLPYIDFDALDAVVATEQDCPSVAANENAQPGFPNCRIPHPDDDIRNLSSEQSGSSYLSVSRYKLLRVEDHRTIYSKLLFVTKWKTSMLSDKVDIHKGSSKSRTDKKSFEEVGVIVLRDSWYHTSAEEGDVVHLCSLTGRFRTDFGALPITLHSNSVKESQYDDLVLIQFPDLLATPTLISDSIDCNRRAALKSRIGSSGLSSRAAILGTMRHSIFERAMKENNFSPDFARAQIKIVVRENAENLIACNMLSSAAEVELEKMLPQLTMFDKQYIALDNSTHRKGTTSAIPMNQFGILEGHLRAKTVHFSASTLDGVEVPMTSPELGLKGNVDCVVEAAVQPVGDDANHPEPTLMSIELKTGHSQTPQGTHLAQLILYTLMLQTRYGLDAVSKQEDASTLNPTDTTAGGMLLYLNHESLRASHVRACLDETKSLIQQRNNLACACARAARPRGIVLSYEDDNESAPRIELSDPPPVELPEVQTSFHLCSRCYARRECMTYSAAEVSTLRDTVDEEFKPTHPQLLEQFTGHLGETDLFYFRTWDRLLDLEADASVNPIAEAWLEDSKSREIASGQCISSLVYDELQSHIERVEDPSSPVIIGLKRAPDSPIQSPLYNLKIEKGCYLTISTDVTSLSVSSTHRVPSVRPKSGAVVKRPFRHQMNVFRGAVVRAEADTIFIRATQDELGRLQSIISRYRDSVMGTEDLKLRADKDDISCGTTTLRQNLINFFTKDREEVDKPEKDPDMRRIEVERRLDKLRDLVVRLRPPIYSDDLKANMFNPNAEIRTYPGCDFMDLIMEFAGFNVDQVAAAEKAMSAQDYTLIQGLPGTGKTTTIAFVARLLAAQGKRVLITSYTHAAIDNVMLKLMDKAVDATSSVGRLFPALVRVGRESSCHPDVRSILVSQIAANLECDNTSRDTVLPSAESLRKVMNEARIVGATALTVPRSALLIKEHFDVVIVDEAGQISQPAILGALMAADSFILVGDHLQLPPLVQSEIAEKGGYGDSMLKRLADANPDAVVQLKHQYRMHSEICQLSSNAIYNGRMVCAAPDRILRLPGFPQMISATFTAKDAPWLTQVLDPQKAVVFVDTDRIRTSLNSPLKQNPSNNNSESFVPLERSANRQKGGIIINEAEAVLVRKLIQALLATGLPASSAGIICPFRAQIRKLNDCPALMALQRDGLEISTIDQFQGRDKDAVILSLVRSNEKGKVGRLLEDKRRINVAITRAKCKMIIVGSFSTLQKGSSVLRDVLDQIQGLGRLEQLPHSVLD